MKDRTYSRLKQVSEKYTGYASTGQLMEEGFTNRQIGSFAEEGMLEKVSHGLYWIQCGEYSKPEEYKAIEVCLVNPRAVVCADSACFYQGLIDVEPKVLSVATLRTDRSRMQMNFPVARHYYSELAFGRQEEVSTRFGTYRVHNIEQSVCDCFRFRKDLEDGMLELIVHSYQEKRSGQTERLMQYASMLRIGKQVSALL